MKRPTVVILGSGNAGYQAAFSLRQEGFDGRIMLAGEEFALPYQRPPLSKEFLTAEQPEPVAFRPERFYIEHDIDLFRGERAVTVDGHSRNVSFTSGRQLAWDHLILALGARPRPLLVSGADLPGVVSLSTIDDANYLHRRIRDSSHIVIIGAGFIGLEIATVAGQLGATVTVLEAQPSVMPRVLSSHMAAFFAARHHENGVRFRFGTSATRIFGDHGGVTGVETTTGERVTADLVVVAIGVMSNDEIGQRSGLEVDNGVVVDRYLRTSHSRVSAIGDCARYPSPFAPGLVRLESVQNATDQARCVAARITGHARQYRSVPWFWSHQVGIKLQIAGITAGHDTSVLRGDPTTNSFSVFCFRDRGLAGVESVGRAGDHMAARQLLAHGISPTPAQAADPGQNLKALLPPRKG